jgi:hypothetical protein
LNDRANLDPSLQIQITQPTPIQNVIVANGEDDYELTFDDGVWALGRAGCAVRSGGAGAAAVRSAHCFARFAGVAAWVRRSAPLV